MTAYYNEIEPYAAQWTRNLAAAGHIASGVVDERSIVDVKATDLAEYGQCHFFAGIAGWSYALRLAGWSDDIPVWTGSCPCQPFSAAGKRGGFDDERHLWPTWFELIKQCRPPVVFGEQVASPDGLKWFDLVSADLERAGYAVGMAVLTAAGAGAPHIRRRIYYVANSVCSGLEGLHKAKRGVDLQSTASDLRRHWLSEPDVGRVAYGVPDRVGQLKAYGNAIVPQVAATFIRAVMESL